MSRQLTDLQRMTQNEVSGDDLLLIRDVSSQTDKAIKKSDLVTGGGGGADLNTIFPVGSVRIFADNLDHSSDYGMTWVRYAQGKTLVGIDSEDADFDNVGDTGGEKTHTLTVDEMPSHNHAFTVPPRYGWEWQNGGGIFGQKNTTAADNSQYTSKTGGGQAHNNLQPYIVVSFWRRTA